MNDLKEYDNKIIGKQIKKYRLANNYSVKKLSELSGISESYIRAIEHGGNSESSSISMDKICKIAEVLNVSLDDIAYTNIEYIDMANASVISEIERELKTLSNADLQLFDKIVGIFVKNREN